MSYAKIRPRRASTTEWMTVNPIPFEGEVCVEYPDDGIGTGIVKIKFGDGVTHWNDLEYGIPLAALSIYGGTPEDSYDIFVRSGSTTEWLDTDPVLGLGEIVLDTTEYRLKLGNGVNKFSEIEYLGANLDMSNLNLDFGDESTVTNITSIFRVRRGTKQQAIEKNILLRQGELFFEVPESGVGTGLGNIKLGDGIHTYEDLPYFLRSGVLSINGILPDDETGDIDISAFEIIPESEDATNIEPSESPISIFGKINHWFTKLISKLKSLAFSDTASTQYTPQGSINTPEITVTAPTTTASKVSGGQAPSLTTGDATVAGTVSNWSAGSITNITYNDGGLTISVGSAPSLTTTSATVTGVVTNWSAGSMPSATDVTVVTSVSATSEDLTFTGTEETITVNPD